MYPLSPDSDGAHGASCGLRPPDPWFCAFSCDCVSIGGSDKDSDKVFAMVCGAKGSDQGKKLGYQINWFLNNVLNSDILWTILLMEDADGPEPIRFM